MPISSGKVQVTQAENGKIFQQKFDFSKVKSKVPFRENEKHIPGGGDLVVFSKKQNFNNIKPKIPFRENEKHIPAGGDKKIFKQKMKYHNHT